MKKKFDYKKWFGSWIPNLICSCLSLMSAVIRYFETKREVLAGLSKPHSEYIVPLPALTAAVLFLAMSVYCYVKEKKEVKERFAKKDTLLFWKCENCGEINGVSEDICKECGGKRIK